MNKPVTVTVDSGKAAARLSGPLVLGDTYAVTFSGLSTAEAASAPEMIVLGPKPREIAARSGEDGVLAMTTKPCVEAFGPLPPPPLPRPKQFPHPPPLANPPVHWRGGPHGSTRMHFYVVAGGQTLAQGDLVLLWAPFEFDEAGEPIQLRGKKGDPGEKGEKGERGEAGRNGVYVAMDGLYAFHISEGGDHPEDGHLWIHAQDESTLYAHDANGNYLLDENGERIPLYYVGDDGHLRYRFFFQDSTHVELDLGKVVTREGLYAFHVSDGSDGEPAGHLMLHGQDLSQLYARDGQGNLILDGDGNPIPIFHIDSNGHLHFTFYGNDGQAHESLDLGDVRGPALTWGDLTDEQKAALKGEKGDEGDKGDQGDPLTWDDLTEEQKASLKGEKGDPGEDGMTEEQIVALVEDTMGEADDAPTAGSGNWVTSGGLWSVEQAILARIMALATQINAIASKTGGALHFKGSVQSASDLPDDGNEPGDTYDVIDEGGMNYAWTGSEWNALGATIDLSAYALKSEVPTVDSTLAVQGAAADAKATGDALAGKQATISDLAAIRSGAEAGATAYQKPEDGIPSTDLASAVQTALTNARTPTAHASTAQTFGVGDETQFGHIKLSDDPSASTLNTDQGTAATPYAVSVVWTIASETASAVAALATVATTGDYDDLTNKPTIPDISGKADSASIAPAFSTSSTYAVGDYVTHEGLLYKCTTAVSTAGAWNAANWTAVSAMGEMPAPGITGIKLNGSALTPVSGVVDVLAVPWANSAKTSVLIGSQTQTIGDSSLVNGTLCAATGEHSHAEGSETRATNFQAHSEGFNTTASGNSAHAEGSGTTAAGNISHSEGLSTYAAGRPSHAEGSETTAAGNASHTDGYRAVTAASGNGSGASTPHDYAYAWQGVSTGGYYRSHGAGTFNINPVGGTAGFYVGEDSLASLLRYAFAAPTPTVSGTTATVACEDRAINDFTVATGITSLTITPPAAVTGRARDFFCRVTLTDASLPTVTLSGATIDIGASEVAGMTQGVNLLMFTEIASGHWLASRRSATD